MSSIAMERSILEALLTIEGAHTSGLIPSSEKIQELTRFADTPQERRRFLDKLDILEGKNMVKLTKSFDKDSYGVQSTAYARERMSMTEAEYQKHGIQGRSITHNSTNTFMQPVGQFNQTFGPNSPIAQTVNIDSGNKVALVQMLNQIASELRKMPDSDHSVTDVEHLKVEVQSEKPRLAKIKEGVESVVSTLKSIASLAPLGEALWKHWEHLQQTGSLL